MTEEESIDTLTKEQIESLAKDQIDSIAKQYKIKRLIPINPRVEVQPPTSSYQKYVYSWLERYPFLVNKPWNRSLNETINTGLMGNGKFGISIDYYVKRETDHFAYVLLHEFIHMALVRKDELFLPNIGMVTQFSENDFTSPYWINEISTVIYNDNILNQYPSNNAHHNKGIGPYAQELFYAMCVNRHPSVPVEWWGVSSLREAHEKMRAVYTLEDFENKFQDNMNFIGNILKIQPNPTIDMFKKNDYLTI